VSERAATSAPASALLHERVSASARSRMSQTALVMGAQRMTYGELEHRSDRLAGALIAAGVSPGDRVALLIPKSPAAIVSMLAALKAGAIYVPVDVANPPARVQRILDSAEPSVVLACAASARLLGRLALGCPLWSVEGELHGARAVADAPDGADGDAPPRAPIGARDPAHMMFTSGSTGEPKGVLITHAMVLAFLDWALPHFGHAPGERISGHPPLHFDLSTFDIFGTLCSGGELHLLPAGIMLPGQLAAFIRDAQLTQWFSVPSTFAYMVRGEALTDGDLPSLKRVIWCGEVMPPAVLAHWMARVPQATYTNLYGPTETTIASSFHTVAEPPGDITAPIPIGTPCAGEQIEVVGEDLGALPDGEAGELLIGGAGVSPGYWRDPQRTAAAFITSPDGRTRRYRTGDMGVRDSHGVLHYLGRRDGQVKTRGYRVELGEIESALGAVPGVGECAVVAVPSDGFEGTAICCAWSPIDGFELDPAALRSALSQSLPGYMLPSRWMALSELPRYSAGKLDRNGLKRQFSERAGDG
jgi:amino acid adenylation domain-containing protein